MKAGVVAGDFQLVYMSPESLLCVLQWREMFRSKIYQKNLVAAIVDEVHCVEKWLVSCMIMQSASYTIALYVGVCKEYCSGCIY